MTVGRSEQAKTLEVDRDLKVLSTVGWVPRVTFLRSLRAPGVVKGVVIRRSTLGCHCP